MFYYEIVRLFTHTVSLKFDMTLKGVHFFSRWHARLELHKHQLF